MPSLMPRRKKQEYDVDGRNDQVPPTALALLASSQYRDELLDFLILVT